MANRKNTFLLKRSNIPGNIPTAGQILLGELALNTADVILYASGTTANSILPIGWDRVARTGDTMTGTLFTPYLSATTVSATTYLNLPPTTFSGGTVTGPTNFTNGLTANTMSATTYYGDGSNLTGISAVATEFVVNCRNQSGSDMYRGQVVYMDGSTGNKPTIQLSIATGETTSARTFGVLKNDIANNAFGDVVTIGSITNLDTRTSATHPFTNDTLNDGDTVYLSPITQGFITNVKPSAPNHLVYIGKVVRTSQTNGYIEYQIQNGYELNELHDVKITGVTYGDLLTYSAYNGSNVWVNSKTLNGSYVITGDTTVGGQMKATTVSATTYQNLPIDVYITGGTYSSGTTTFTNNTGGTFTVNGLFTGSTLQQTYNNSTTPEIVTNSTLGSLSIKNGTGNADNITKLLQGINTGGTETSFIRADGGISGTTLTATTITATSITATTHYGAWSGAILPTTITEAKIKGTASNSYVAFGAGVLDTLDASANFTYDKNNLRLLVGSAAGTYSAGHTIYNNSNTFDIFIERTSATGIAGIGLMAGTSLFQIYKLGQSAAGVFQTSTVPNASLAQFVSGTYNQNFALHGSNIYMFTSLASNSFAVGFTSGGTLFGNMENMGTVASAPVHIMKTGTTDQQRIGYNSTNYYTTTVSSAGTVTYDAVGASAGFRFNDSISATTYLGLPTDVYVTGFTYSNNTFTIDNNTGGTLNLLVNTMSGLTVNGTLSATTISAVTISATTISAVTVTANNIIRNWTSTSAISTINSGINEVLWVQKIPAGTVKVGDYLDFYNVFAMTNSANAKNIRVYIGTSADTVTCATTATNQIALVGAFGSGTASSSFARRLGVRSMTRLIGWLDGTTSYGGDAGTTSITNTAITVPNFSADTYYIVTGNRASGSELLRLDFAKLSIVPTLN